MKKEKKEMMKDKAKVYSFIGRDDMGDCDV